MSLHSASTSSARQAMRTSGIYLGSTRALVGFTYRNTQSQADRHMNSAIVQTKTTGRDRKGGQPSATIRSCCSQNSCSVVVVRKLAQQRVFCLIDRRTISHCLCDPTWSSAGGGHECLVVHSISASWTLVSSNFSAS